jgi:hypothetical protein
MDKNDLQVENARLRAALEAVEWLEIFIDNGGYDDHWEHRCVWCRNEKDDGHADNCQRQRALGR